jgi:hypothetical protein
VQLLPANGLAIGLHVVQRVADAVLLFLLERRRRPPIFLPSRSQSSTVASPLRRR